MRARQYTAWVRDSSGSETGKIVDWSSGGSQSASAEFTGLALGTYTVWVVMQTVDGSWFKLGDHGDENGEVGCTVTTAAPTPTATASPTATSTAAPSANGSLSCSTTSSSITVTLDAAEGTTAWEVWADHSSGYPRYGQQIALDDAFFKGSTTHTFSPISQGTWSVYGTATLSDGSKGDLATISCTVGGGL